MSENKNDTNKVIKRGKSNGYTSATLNAKRNRKQEEAWFRQRDHDALTVEAKIAKALKRRGSSKREVSRLMKMVQVSPAPAVKPAIAPNTVGNVKPKSAKKKVAKK
jgi:hypothetical protein